MTSTKKPERILLAVDVQEGFATQVSRHVVKPIEKLQAGFDHVILTKFSNPNPSPFRTILNYSKLAPGDPDTELAMTPREDALIIERSCYTCVTPKLLDYLKEHGADEVYVCGIATEACVLKTVLDLFEANVRPLIIEDLCASDQDRHYHDIAMEILAKAIGPHNVINLQTVKDRLHVDA